MLLKIGEKTMNKFSKMKRNDSIRLVCVCLTVCIYALFAMASNYMQDGQLYGDGEWTEFRDYLNEAIENCTGTELTREEMGECVYRFEELQKAYSGKRVAIGSPKVPKLVLKKPAKHTVTDNTRYDITTLPKDGAGFIQGISIKAYEIEDDETTVSDETAEETTTEATTETSLDEQVSISEWLDYLDGWWVGDLHLTSDDYDETKQGRVNWRAGIEMNNNISLSIEQDTGALVLETSSGDKSWIYKVDDNHILVKTAEGESKWVRDNSQD
jgi:hypothetical protein